MFGYTQALAYTQAMSLPGVNQVHWPQLQLLNWPHGGHSAHYAGTAQQVSVSSAVRSLPRLEGGWTARKSLGLAKFSATQPTDIVNRPHHSGSGHCRDKTRRP